MDCIALHLKHKKEISQKNHQFVNTKIIHSRSQMFYPTTMLRRYDHSTGPPKDCCTSVPSRCKHWTFEHGVKWIMNKVGYRHALWGFKLLWVASSCFEWLQAALSGFVMLCDALCPGNGVLEDCRKAFERGLHYSCSLYTILERFVSPRIPPQNFHSPIFSNNGRVEYYCIVLALEEQRDNMMDQLLFRLTVVTALW